MKTVELEKQIFYLPESWGEVTVKQFMDLRNLDSSDIIHFYSIMLQAPYNLIFGARPEQLEQHIMPLLKWYFDEDYDLTKLPVPKHLTIYDREEIDKVTCEIKVPNIKMESFGQKLHFDEIMKKNDEDPILKMPEVMGVYFYSKVNESTYNDEKLENFIQDVIMRCRIAEIFPIANFFFRSIKKSLLKKSPFLNLATRAMN